MTDIPVGCPSEFRNSAILQLHPIGQGSHRHDKFAVENDPHYLAVLGELRRWYGELLQPASKFEKLLRKAEELTQIDSSLAPTSTAEPQTTESQGTSSFSAHRRATVDV